MSIILLLEIIILLEVIYYISGGENMFIDCAFEGGGIKGLAYVGALEYFESNGFQIHRAVGTSVGAIFAALAVARFTSKEIKKIIDELSVEQIVDKNGFIASVRGLGFNNIRKFEEKMKEILACKSIYTFADLRFGSDYLLKVIVTDLDKKQRVVIPDDLPKYKINKDTFSVAKALAMSSSLPIVYQTYKYKEYKFIDGGAVEKFPIRLLSDSKNLVIGLRIGNDKMNFSKRITNRIFRDNYNTNVKELDGNHIIVNINTYGLKASEFSKGLEYREELYRAGYNSLKSYFYYS